MEWLAERALEHVRDACRELELPGLEITASAGWAVYPDDVSSVEELLTVADLSLRAAKAAGKNRIARADAGPAPASLTDSAAVATRIPPFRLAQLLACAVTLGE